MFLYNKVLKKEIDPISDFVRPKKKQKLPVVLTQSEIKTLLLELNELKGSYWLAACLMYGSGLRLMECMRLRIMNINFDHKFANIKTRSLKEIWRGPEMTGLRQMHVEGRGADFLLCKRCPDWQYRSWTHNYWKIAK